MHRVNISPPAGEHIPTLDLGLLNSERGVQLLAKQMNEACTQTGFFYVVNHEISQTVIESVMLASKLFFEQPIEIRMRSIKDEFHRGYLPFGTTQYPGQGPDLKDSFDIGIDLPKDHPDVQAGLPLHGPNQWPELKNFKAPTTKYFSAILNLGLRLLEIFAQSLGLDKTFFTQFYSRPTVLMRMMHYLPQTTSLSTNSIGATAHTDFGLITILGFGRKMLIKLGKN